MACRLSHAALKLQVAAQVLQDLLQESTAADSSFQVLHQTKKLAMHTVDLCAASPHFCITHSQLTWPQLIT